MTAVTYSDILYTGKTCHEKQGEGFWKTTFVVAEDLEVIIKRYITYNLYK